MKKLLGLVLSLSLLSGCTTPTGQVACKVLSLGGSYPPGTPCSLERARTLNDTMASWISSKEADLVAAWGTPNGTFGNRDGSRILTWETYQEKYQASTNHTTYGWCKKNFLTDAEGYVRKWSFSGYCLNPNNGGEPKNKPIPTPTL